MITFTDGVKKLIKRAMKAALCDDKACWNSKGDIHNCCLLIITHFAFRFIMHHDWIFSPIFSVQLLLLYMWFLLFIFAMNLLSRLLKKESNLSFVLFCFNPPNNFFFIFILLPWWPSFLNSKICIMCKIAHFIFERTPLSLWD